MTVDVRDPPPEATDPGLAVAPAGAGLVPPPARRRRRVGLSLWGPPLAVAAGFVGLWYLVTYVLLDPGQRFLLPPPHEVVAEGLFDESFARSLSGLWATTQVALVGLAIAVVLGVAFAIAMSQAAWVERSFYPYAVVLQTVPILALVPLIGFWFDYNFRSRVLVCVIIALFPIITNTLFGLQSADAGHHDLFRLHGAGRLTVLRKLTLPGALPAVFTGFRISAGLSVIGAIVGDFFFRQGEAGIGRLLDVYRNRLQTEQLIVAIFLSSLLGLVVFWAFGLLTTFVLRSWHDAHHRT